MLTVFFGLLSLPPLIFGLYLLQCWFRFHASDYYYVEYPYLPIALAASALGIACLCTTLYGAWRRSFYGAIFLIPLIMGLVSMVMIPDALPHNRSMSADINYMGHVSAFLRVWYEAHRKFPADVTEFQEAMKTGPAAWGDRMQSPASVSMYLRKGVRVPYQIVVTQGAVGPQTSNLSDRPGVVYYCVSDDQQEFWLTLTSIRSDLAHKAKFMTLAPGDGEALVVKGAGKDYPPAHTNRR
jgi:hypothetical protein